MALIWYFR